jgi:hypothetical protein
MANDAVQDEHFPFLRESSLTRGAFAIANDTPFLYVLIGGRPIGLVEGKEELRCEEGGPYGFGDCGKRA